MTNPKHRATLPQVLKTIAEAPNVDIGLFFSSGFGALAPQVATMFEDLRGRHRQADLPELAVAARRHHAALRPHRASSCSTSTRA